LEPIGLTKREAAESLGISVSTLESEMAARKIQYKKIGKLVRFHPEHLHRYMLDGIDADQDPATPRRNRTKG
jgi:excisionase family DNA binding protein